MDHDPGMHGDDEGKHTKNSSERLIRNPALFPEVEKPSMHSTAKSSERSEKRKKTLGGGSWE